MTTPSPALQLLLLMFAGWVSRRQQEVIDYLKEENRGRSERLSRKGEDRLDSRLGLSRQDSAIPQAA